MLTSNALSRRPRALVARGAALVTLGALAVAGCIAEAPLAGDEERTASADQQALDSIQQHPHKALCATGAPGEMRCHARVRVQPDGQTVQPFASPSGLTPAQLQTAYAIPTAGGSGVTVAIVDAYDDPNAESDLAVYRAQFGLPPCTTANGCFKKVNQSGSASSLPAANSGWAGEISLDLDMVSAACPNCKILLVEASSASMANLGAALNTAVSMGAAVVSNSYGGSEASSDSTTDSQYFNHPGVAITVSSGDSGYGVQYPASSPHVIAVGGTSLAASTSPRGWAEGAWSGAGAGCSTIFAKPSYQKDTGCAKRTVADVSAVADPNTGVAVYDTYGGASAGATGWIIVGGTSAAAPLVAAILAVTGEASQSNASWFYGHSGDLFDVTSGSDGSCSSSAKYLCTAGAGYDGPTGLGTPDGKLMLSGTTSSSSSSSSTSTTSSSSSSSTSSTSSTSSSGSSGGGTCGHPICSTGAKLTSTCDACVTKICASDTYCCHTKWDSVCVGEVASICGQTCP